MTAPRQARPACMQDSASRRHPGSSIRDAPLPQSTDESPLEIVLGLNNGTRHHLAIEGRNGRFQDVWTFGRVIVRVVELVSRS